MKPLFKNPIYYIINLYIWGGGKIRMMNRNISVINPLLQTPLTVLFAFVTCVGIVSSCSMKEKLPPNFDEKDSLSKVTLSGEVGVGQTRVFVGDSAGSPYKYLWSRTPTKDLTLYLVSANGVNKGAISGVTLNIQPDGKCTFSTPVPAPIAAWFDGNNDYVAGAIDVAGSSAPGQWVFTQPSNISYQKNNAYLPMYFPLTKASNNKVKSIFKSFGSVLAIRITNNSPTGYDLGGLDVQSGSFATSGTASFAAGLPSTNPALEWADAPNYDDPTIIHYTGNTTVAPNDTDTIYVWVRQHLTTLDRIYLTFHEAGTGRGPISIRSPQAALVDNGFYGIPIEIIPANRGRLPLSYFHKFNASGPSSIDPIAGRFELVAPYVSGQNFYLYGIPIVDASDTTICQSGYRPPSLSELMMISPWMGQFDGPSGMWNQEVLTWAGGLLPGSPNFGYAGMILNQERVFNATVGGATYGVSFKAYAPLTPLRNNFFYALVSFTDIATNLTYTYARRYTHFDGTVPVPWGPNSATAIRYYDANYASSQNLMGMGIVERFYKMGLPTDADLTGTVATDWYWGPTTYTPGYLSSYRPNSMYEPNEVRLFLPYLGWGFYYYDDPTPNSVWAFEDTGLLPGTGPGGIMGGGGVGGVGPGAPPGAAYFGTGSSRLQWDDWNITLFAPYFDDHYMGPVRGIETGVQIGK
jgi:hypothetical protein